MASTMFCCSKVLSNHGGTVKLATLLAQKHSLTCLLEVAAVTTLKTQMIAFTWLQKSHDDEVKVAYLTIHITSLGLYVICCNLPCIVG